MPNSFRKILLIFFVFCLPLILPNPAFCQSYNSNFNSQTYATFCSGFYHDSDENVKKRYGTMFGLKGGLSHKFAPLLTFRSGLTWVFDTGSFKDKDLGLKGESDINYFVLDAGVYYSKPIENIENFNWFVGGGIVFSQIRESAEFISDYGSGKETQSGNSFGLKLAGGVEDEEFYIQLSVNPSSGDFESNLASLEFGWKWDISNIAK